MVLMIQNAEDETRSPRWSCRTRHKSKPVMSRSCRVFRSVMYHYVRYLYQLALGPGPGRRVGMW